MSHKIVNQKVDLNLQINGEQIEARVPVRTNLVDFVREYAGLTGAHVGCEQGVCGACTMEVNGLAVRGCLMLAVQAQGSAVTTIEGVGLRPVGRALQDAFVSNNALQCGYCTPGMLTSALEYIESGGAANRTSIREHLSGNYCRCTGYQAIVDAVVEVIEAHNS